MQVTTADEFRLFRITRNLSQPKLGDLLGLSTKQVCRLENGLGRIRKLHTLAIAELARQIPEVSDAK